ncbi:unnamed protein product, partial [Polarella glacialis]
LDLSEFVLRRITHAVNVLQDPQKHDRPMVLREYTEEMVQEVCKDLKQWLEQLATLLSLYHVHILDQEAEKRQVAARLHDLQSKFDQHEKERKDAVLRHTRLEERWKEDRMQRRAEALLGIKNQGEDAKIYSQRDVDEMMKEWEKERVDPLLEELKLARDEMLSKLQGDKKPPRPREKAPEDLGGIGRKELDLMTSIMSAASEKVSDSTMSDLLTQVGESISSGGADLADLLRAVQRCPPPASSAEKTADVKDSTDTNASAEKTADILQNLIPITDELQNVEETLRASGAKTGMDKIANLISWAKDMVKQTKESVTSGEAMRMQPPPKWDLDALTKLMKELEDLKRENREKQNELDRLKSQKQAPKSKPATPGGEDNGAEERGLRQSEANDFQEQLRRLREQLEAQLAEARREAEKQRQRAEDALKRLADETKKADQMLAELRKRLLEMERLLQKAGLGQEAADAIFESGLADFMKNDVFDRLYRDALRRMRSQAEAQARLLEESSAQFLRVINDLYQAPRMALDAAMGMLDRPRRLSNVGDPSPMFQPTSPLQVMRLALPSFDNPTPAMSPAHSRLRSKEEPAEEVGQLAVGPLAVGHLAASAVRALGAADASPPVPMRRVPPHRLGPVAGGREESTEGLLLVSQLGSKDRGRSLSEDEVPGGRSRAPATAPAAYPGRRPRQTADGRPGAGQQAQAAMSRMIGPSSADTSLLQVGMPRGELIRGSPGSVASRAARSRSPQMTSVERSAASLALSLERPHGHGYGGPEEVSLNVSSFSSAPITRVEPSRLLPPNLRNSAASDRGGALMRGSPTQMGKGRQLLPGSAPGSAASSQVLKSAGTMSMPQLGPPRSRNGHSPRLLPREFAGCAMHSPQRPIPRSGPGTSSAATSSSTGRFSALPRGGPPSPGGPGNRRIAS